jgi:hypothetical protein
MFVFILLGNHLYTFDHLPCPKDAPIHEKNCFLFPANLPKRDAASVKTIGV